MPGLLCNCPWLDHRRRPQIVLPRLRTRRSLCDMECISAHPHNGVRSQGVLWEKPEQEWKPQCQVCWAPGRWKV